MRILFAALHLLALGIGLGAVWSRARALRGPSALDAASLRRVFYADAWWGVSAILWISTGLTRVFASMEKSTAYYMQNHLFWTKMALLALILVLEIRPMLTFIRWRAACQRIDPRHRKRWVAGDHFNGPGARRDHDGVCRDRDGARVWRLT